MSSTLSARAFLPPGLADELDVLIAVKGRVTVETTKEWYYRWGRNVGLNILFFPVSLLGALFPFASPLTVNISTSFIEGSPEECFFSLVAIEVATGRILYQNDLFTRNIPRDEDDLGGTAEDLLEAFRRSAHE